jgi:hypothetical protein
MVGELFGWIAEGPVEFAKRRTKIFGSVFTMGYIGQPMVSVCSPADVQRLLLSEPELVESTDPRKTFCHPEVA